MQACIYETYGSPDVVRIAEVASPACKPHELLVRVRATSVTTADWRLRASAFPRGFWLMGRLMLGLVRPRNPILGMDFSGVVAATGSAVTGFQVGDHVFGSTSTQRRGAHAQMLAVAASGAILHKPACLSDEQAAAIPFGANCALEFLRDVAQVRPGQRVLVIGASGGVGVWAVQLARHFGAEVSGVSSAANLELVHSLGAHHVLDYAAGALEPSTQRYDVILDTVGATRFANARALLSERGCYVPLNNTLGEALQGPVTSRRDGQRQLFAISQNRRESLEYITHLIESGELKPVIDKVYPMAQIAAAHRHVESRHKRGSVIVSIDP